MVSPDMNAELSVAFEITKSSTIGVIWVSPNPESTTKPLTLPKDFNAQLVCWVIPKKGTLRYSKAISSSFSLHWLVDRKQEVISRGEVEGSSSKYCR